MQIDILKAAWFTPMSRGRWGLPLIIWSMPGEAKTSLVQELCATFNLPCVTLSPGEMGEGAFGVVPVPDLKSGLLRYPAPEWTQGLKEGGVVFIDEMSSTPPALQPPLLGLLLNGTIGGQTLHPRVRRVGAANPPEVAAAGFDLAPPVANRMGHLDWEAPTVQEHSAYMMRATTGGGEGDRKITDAAAEEARVMAAWPDAWARSVGLETAFLQRRPHLKNKPPKMDDAAAGRSWPSDRTWEFAVRALASSETHGLSEAQRDEFVGSFIGTAVCGELMTFIREADLPDPAALLDGKWKGGFKHKPARLDRTHAVLASCAALVAPKNAERRTERIASFYELMHEMLQDNIDHDILVPAAQTLINEGAIHGGPARKVLSAINPMLRIAK